jgi:hypothetical protein
MIEIGDKRTIGEIMAGTENISDPNNGMPARTKFPVMPIVLGPGTVHMQPPAMTLDLTKAVVEKGVPLPPAKVFQRKGSSWLPLLKSMAPGDSVFFASASLPQLGYARIVAKKHDFHISIRVVAGGVRLWLVDPTDDGLGA